MNFRRRIERLRAEMPGAEVDTMLVSAPANRRYLSGFSGSNGSLIITESDAVLATDFRYLEQAASESPDFRVHRIEGGKPWLPALLAELGTLKMGVEANHVTLAAHQKILKELEESEDVSDITIEPTTGLAEGVRAVKDADELALIGEAVRIADLAMGAVGPNLTPGMTERQAAWELESEMRRLGADGPAFDIIVGAGANGALPHHRADDAIMRRGDPVVIDMGAEYRGYRSDLTRTFAVGGQADDMFERVYAIVLQAQIAAIEAARPGMSAKDLDGVAREVIKSAGYGEEFGHGLGHGVGLDIHERPMITPASDDEIADGMIFTVEPGIYISGWGGVRIEDIVVMENGRARPLTAAPK